MQAMAPDRATPRRSSPLAASISIALLALAGLAFHLTPWAKQASEWAVDQGFGALRALGPKAAPDDIVVIGLDDAGIASDVPPDLAALRRLPETLLRVAKGRPRAVALLAPLPSASLEASLPGLDGALATALAVTRAAAPLAIGITVDGRGEVVPIHEPLLRGVDAPRALAFSLLPRDRDGVVRHLDLALPTQQGAWPTAAGWLCAVLGGACAEGRIDYALGPAYRYIPVRRLLEIREAAALERLFRGRVVYLAPVLAPEERVPQPVSLAGWEQPGSRSPAVLAHAQSLRTLLHGTPVRDVPLPLVILAIAAAALVILSAPPMAPVVAALGAAATATAMVVALRQGWHLPPAAILATLVAAAVVSRVLGRRSPA